mmetsp:Transcript_52255/g.111756  ORF Transcript_52255/g.111756 Transcript_52255/m.111756 type:complete len:297 (-) Transcript_52255:1048-1938(-)
MQVGAALAGEGDDCRRLWRLERVHVGPRNLVGVGGADGEEVGRRSQGEQHLDGLVRRPVLAQPDGVVSGDVDYAEVGEGRDAHRSRGVADEVEEGGAEWAQHAVGAHAVAERGHRVLAHAEADVAPLRRGGLEVERALELREVGGREVGGATDQVGDRLRQLVEHLLRRLARGERLVGGRVRGQRRLPSLGQLAALASQKVRCELWVLLGVGGEERPPGGVLGGASRTARAVGGGHVIGHGEELLLVEAELLLEVGEVGMAERRTVHLLGALLGGAIANGGGHLDERGARGFVLGS